MKLVRKAIEKDGSGRVTLRPEVDEDMWHAYNLINEGDQVRSAAVRSVCISLFCHLVMAEHSVYIDGSLQNQVQAQPIPIGFD